MFLQSFYSLADCVSSMHIARVAKWMLCARVWFDLSHMFVFTFFSPTNFLEMVWFATEVASLPICWTYSVSVTLESALLAGCTIWLFLLAVLHTRLNLLDSAPFCVGAGIVVETSPFYIQRIWIYRLCLPLLDERPYSVTLHVLQLCTCRL